MSITATPTLTHIPARKSHQNISPIYYSFFYFKQYSSSSTIFHPATILYFSNNHFLRVCWGEVGGFLLQFIYWENWTMIWRISAFMINKFEMKTVTNNKHQVRPIQLLRFDANKSIYQIMKNWFSQLKQLNSSAKYNLKSCPLSRLQADTEREKATS